MVQIVTYTFLLKNKKNQAYSFSSIQWCGQNAYFMLFCEIIMPFAHTIDWMIDCLF